MDSSKAVVIHSAKTTTTTLSTHMIFITTSSPNIKPAIPSPTRNAATDPTPRSSSLDHNEFSLDTGRTTSQMSPSSITSSIPAEQQNTHNSNKYRGFTIAPKHHVLSPGVSMTFTSEEVNAINNQQQPSTNPKTGITNNPSPTNPNAGKKIRSAFSFDNVQNNSDHHPPNPPTVTPDPDTVTRGRCPPFC
ncbi:hypothetical protein AYO45_00480 [Gammaproteobacteria bacterium SCGC AG-212-F23]|nr:hypothetical protein AYO45_00480 [Gammaproteobacteria bacterium SCGC AG-212-F23]